jgi:hypothetical protein
MLRRVKPILACDVHAALVLLVAGLAAASCSPAHRIQRTIPSSYQSMGYRWYHQNTGDPGIGRTYYLGLRPPSHYLEHHKIVSDGSGMIRVADGNSSNRVSCGSDRGRNGSAVVIGPGAWDQDDDGARLAQAVAMLPRAGNRVIYLRGGVYRAHGAPLLDAAADGVTIQACPGEAPVLEGRAGAPTLILRGSRRTVLRGLIFAGPASVGLLLDGAVGCVVADSLFLHATEGIRLEHASGNEIVHDVVLDMATTGIELKDGSDANLVSDNAIDGAAAPETTGGGIFLHGARDNRIAHNEIRDTAGFGIGILNWDDVTVNVGNVVEYNLLRRTALGATDSGAIYVLGRSGVDSGTVIAGNVVDGVGAPGQHAVGVYLDDSTSGAEVTGNLIRGIASDAVQIHGGHDNVIEGNILDLGADRPSAVLFQAAPADTHPTRAQTGNVVRRNVIVSLNAKPRPFVWYDGGSPLVSGNFYVTSGPPSRPPDAPVVDLQPVDADPDLARDGARDGYRRIQLAAAAIGFRPLDLALAGARGARPQ